MTQKQNQSAAAKAQSGGLQQEEFIEKQGKSLTLVAAPLTPKQIIKIFQRTPKNHIYTRPAKGGGTWDYVTGVYVKKVLNFVFGWLWDFEIVEHGREGEQVWVKGRLTIRDPKTREPMIVKMQFGRADVKLKKDSKVPLDYGNDLKAAATDALKKCASELGIASDVYGKNEFREIGVGPTPTSGAPSNGTPQYQCHGCGEPITKAERDFYVKQGKKPLCRRCRKEKANWHGERR